METLSELLQKIRSIKLIDSYGFTYAEVHFEDGSVESYEDTSLECLLNEVLNVANNK